jgi:hypothetical protein
MRREYKKRSIPQIAAKHGVSWSTVHRALTSDPAFKTRKVGRRPGVRSASTLEMAETCRKMRKKGYRWKEIGQELNVTAAYASRIARNVK